jgi:hypothetical protein
MRSPSAAGVTTLAVLLVTVSSLPAKVIAPQPVPNRVARADLVLVGKITSIEKKLSVAPDGGERLVAIVQIEEALLGGKGLTHVRVGFYPGPNRRFPHLAPQVGQKALFFLSSEPRADFLSLPFYFDLVDSSDPQFAGEVGLARRCGKLLADPDAGLKAQAADDRLLTASLLLTRYRTPRPGAVRQEPIAAAQSRLILETLAEADWERMPQGPAYPHTLFLQLGLTDKDGWTPPPDARQFADAAKKWLRANAATYRIQRWAGPEKDR